MLRVSLPDLRSGAVETVGELAAGDPLLTDAEWPLASAVRVRGRFSGAGEHKYYWKARVETAVRAQCRRCLEEVRFPLELALSLVFSADDDAPEGEGCYRIAPRAQVLDLTGAVREELLLAMPRYVECRSDCRGLCPRCGANLNAGPCGCRPEADARWEQLRELTETRKPTD